MGIIASFLILVLWIFVIIVFVRVAYSWLGPYPNNPVARFAFLTTEPVLAPVRHRLPPVSGLDLSPLVVTVVCYLLIHVLGSIG
jgi:YggT family protein